MRFITNLKSSFLTGKAFMKFHKGEYNDVIDILNKTISLNPNSERIEISLSYLGQSYMKINKLDDALKIIGDSYKLFNENYTYNNKDKDYINEFSILIDSYIFLLEKVNMKNKISELKEKKSHILMTQGK